jgi:uracil-DNA glycosylase
MAMRDLQNTTVRSYFDWWTDAGLVDPVQDNVCAWLQPPTMVAEPIRSAVLAPKATASQVAEAPAAPFSHNQPQPHTLSALDQWLADDPALPGAAWSSTRILPTGPENAPLMIVSDMPDPDDLTAGHLLAGPVGELFDAMLGAIGFARQEQRVSSIALTRPPGGRWDDATAAALRDIMFNHISVARPQRLLLLGQSSCRLLTGEDVPADGHGLRNINHYGATTAAVAIHHPRLLLDRQALKRGAWTALKQLREPA